MAAHGVDRAALKRFGEDFPVTIYADLPLDDADKMQTLRKKAIATNTPLYLYPEYYAPLKEGHIETVNRQALDMSLYAQVNEKASQALESFQSNHAKQLEQLNFFRLHSRHVRRVIAADKQTLEFIETLPVKPPNPKQEIKMDRLRKRSPEAKADTQSDK